MHHLKLSARRRLIQKRWTDSLVWFVIQEVINYLICCVYKEA